MKYRLPSGNWVNDKTKYLNNWNKLIDFFEKEFGFVGMSFDPVLVVSADNYPIKLDPFFAISIFEKITKEKWTDE